MVASKPHFFPKQTDKSAPLRYQRDWSPGNKTKVGYDRLKVCVTLGVSGGIQVVAQIVSVFKRVSQSTKSSVISRLARAAC